LVRSNTLEICKNLEVLEMDKICAECKIKLTEVLYDILCPYCKSLCNNERYKLLRELYSLQIDNED